MPVQFRIYYNSKQIGLKSLSFDITKQHGIIIIFNFIERRFKLIYKDPFNHQFQYLYHLAITEAEFMIVDSFFIKIIEGQFSLRVI